MELVQGLLRGAISAAAAQLPHMKTRKGVKNPFFGRLQDNLRKNRIFPSLTLMKKLDLFLWLKLVRRTFKELHKICMGAINTSQWGGCAKATGLTDLAPIYHGRSIRERWPFEAATDRGRGKKKKDGFR